MKGLTSPRPQNASPWVISSVHYLDILPWVSSEWNNAPERACWAQARIPVSRACFPICRVHATRIGPGELRREACRVTARGWPSLFSSPFPVAFKVLPLKPRATEFACMTRFSSVQTATVLHPSSLRVFKRSFWTVFHQDQRRTAPQSGVVPFAPGPQG